MVTQVTRIQQGMPMFNEEMKEAAVQALQNDRYTMGENVYKFEEEFASYIGVKYAVSTNSGTAALQLSLLALGVSHGDQVVTTPFSFIATANSVIQAGGFPRFVDIDSQNYNIDVILALRAAGEGVRGFLPVHLFGLPVDIAPMLETAESAGQFVVEDACQAHGATYRGKKVGSLGDVGCFSFYPSKNMTVLGDGGMVTTNDSEVAKKIAKLRDCGRVTRYEHDLLGYTCRLNTVNAAIGRVQLRYLDGWNAARRSVAAAYKRELSNIPVISLPRNEPEGAESVYHQFVITTEKREGLRQFLQSAGIESGVHYPIPIHLQPLYVKERSYTKGAYPKSERLSLTCLSLPMHPFLSVDDVKYICETTKEFFRKGGH